MSINNSGINGAAINGSSVAIEGDGAVTQSSTVSGRCGATGAVTQQASTHGTVAVTSNNIVAVTQSATVYGYGGAYGVVAQLASVSGSATTTIVGVGIATQNASVSGEALVGGIVSSTVTQAVSAYGYGGAYGSVTQPAPTASGQGVTGSVAYGSVTQSISVAGAGAIGVVAYGAVTQSVALGTWAIGSVTQGASITSTPAVVENNLVAYAMNIKTAETTVYTNYDFKFIVRMGNEFYGVKSDGLYQLTGTTDNGTAIDSRFRTAETDFGSSYVKRMPYVYMDSDTATKIKPLADNAGTQSYDSAFAGRRTHLSRGLSGRFWSVEVSNKSGVPMKVGSLELFAENLSRKV